MRNVLSFLLCIIICGGTVPAYALETALTPDYEFMDNAPIIITAYQTSLQGRSMAAIEVYNDSDEPVDLSDWSVWLTLKDNTSTAVTVNSPYDGIFLPGEHVVYAPGVSTTLSFENVLHPTAIAAVEFRYTGTDTAYKPAVAMLKDQSDLPYFRNYTSTGYSTATQPFLASAERPFYDDGLYVAPATSAGLRIVEVYPYSSDCAPNDNSVLCADYIKLQNTSDSDVSLGDYVLRTDSNSSSRTSTNTFAMSGILTAGEYVTIFQTDAGGSMSLTNSGGYAWIEDEWGLARYDDTMTKYIEVGAENRGYAYSLETADLWVWTTTPQPNGPNVITRIVDSVAECPEGKYRSPDTGRCRTIEEAVNALSACEEGYERNSVTNRCRSIAASAVAELLPCEEGYERNPATNRCRKIAVLATASLTPCLEGQERNPATNRCRSIASAVAELLPCEEGYERNPATNRCRKEGNDAMPVAAFPVTPVQTAATDQAGWWAFGIVTAIAVGYGVWEWRMDIANLGRRFLGIFARTK